MDSTASIGTSIEKLPVTGSTVSAESTSNMPWFSDRKSARTRRGKRSYRLPWTRPRQSARQSKNFPSPDQQFRPSPRATCPGFQIGKAPVLGAVSALIDFHGLDRVNRHVNRKTSRHRINSFGRVHEQHALVFRSEKRPYSAR